MGSQIITRRQLVLASVCNLFIHDALSQSYRQDWKIICAKWLDIFLPPDEKGIGGNSDEVWVYLNSLLEDRQFKAGFIRGIEASAKLPPPHNATELHKRLLAGDKTSQFLNAFFELITEAFYGSAIGFKDIGLTAPPQPLGYPVL